MKSTQIIFCTFVLIFTLSAGSIMAKEAKIIDFSGNPTVNNSDISPDQSLSAGDKFEATLNDSSYIDVQFDDGHKIRFQNARGELKNLGDEVNLKLDQGKAYTSFDTSVKNSNLKISTPNSIAGIRGTKFFLKATPEQTYVCVCIGTVDIRKKGLFYRLFGETLTVPKGHDAHVYADEPMPESQPNEQMVNRTWEVFSDMGFKVPKDKR